MNGSKAPARHGVPRTAFALAALLILPALAGLATAEPNPIRAAIAAPADGSVHHRAEAITFTDGSTGTSSCPPVSWTWKFGDGHEAQGAEVTHAYAATGNYSVTLQVVGSCGRRHSDGISLQIVNAPPEAHLVASGSLVAGEELALDGSGSVDADGVLASYRFTLDGEAFAPQDEPVLRLHPTRAGEHTATLVVVDAEGAESVPVSIAFTLTPGPLASIVLEGPGQVVAGSNATYAIEGSDTYGNPVPTQETQLAFAAPEKAGPVVVRYAEGDVEGTKAVEIVAAALSAIAIEGPTSLKGGETANYTARGQDAYGNPVSLATETFAYTAPDAPGPAEVCHEESGVRGCLVIEILHGALAAILVEGPDSVEAGAFATYALSGLDARGQPVPLASQNLTVQAPTLAGSLLVSYEEQGVRGEKTVTVVAGPLSVIVVTGPDHVVRHETATFEAAGADAYGNPVPLANESIAFTPVETGPARVCVTQSNVTGCAETVVLSAHVSRIVVTTSSAATNVRRAVNVTAAAYDAHGNLLPEAVFSWTASFGKFTSDGIYLPDRPGTASLTATAAGVSGAASIVVSTSLNLTLHVEQEQPTLAALQGGVSGSFTALFLDGAPVAGAIATVTVTRLAAGFPLPFVEKMSIRTDAAGIGRFHLSLLSALPGEYRVDVVLRVPGNSGGATASYFVGA